MKKKLLKIKKLYREAGSIKWMLSFFKDINKIYDCIYSKEYDDAHYYADNILKENLLGYYYKAKIDYLYGNDLEAKEYIELFLSENQEHISSYYLYVDILYFLNEKEVAWNILKKLLIVSKRRKTWQYLAKFVENTDDFLKYQSLLLDHYPDFYQKPIYDVLEHFTLAARNSKNTSQVVPIWKTLYSSEKAIIKKSRYSDSYTIEMATIALKDTKMAFDRAGIEFFLISGTLLGCIRENSLLGHDKDIDLGVWDNNTKDNIINALRIAGCFYILPSTSDSLIVARHINGIAIDIFIHYRSEDNYYHLGSKCAWHNTPFTLVSRTFLGQNYLIPKDYDKYLKENYGNWKKTKEIFDSGLDTPNMTIIDINLMIIYLYKKLLCGVVDKDRYFDSLKNYSDYF